MFENIIKFIAKVDDKESHWYVQNGTSFEIAEKMCLQFLQYLAQIKAQQTPSQPPVEASPTELEQPKAE